MVGSINKNIRIELLLIYFYSFGYLRFQLHGIRYKQVGSRIGVTHQDMIVTRITNAQATSAIRKVSLSHYDDIQLSFRTKDPK